MSDAEPTPPPKIGGYRLRADGAPRVNTSKSGPNRGGKYQTTKDNPAMAAARAMYEATPGMTCLRVAEESGIPEGTVRRWKAQYGWKSAARTVPNLAGRAGHLANTFKAKMSELGQSLSDDVTAAEVARELSAEHAVNIRAAIIDRHRKEWSAPRKLAYEAIQKSKIDPVGAFEHAKLAKITAETLQIVQNGECRAYGLDANTRGADGGTVVVLERTTTALPPDDGVGTLSADVGAVPVVDDGKEDTF